jgi:hypothetical protein
LLTFSAATLGIERLVMVLNSWLRKDCRSA